MIKMDMTKSKLKKIQDGELRFEFDFDNKHFDKYYMNFEPYLPVQEFFLKQKEKADIRKSRLIKTTGAEYFLEIVENN